ncbi:hypothetical protein Pcinc_016683 [Petrolisthes cinctipes]|uniref:Medium-chain acyl-CoA ligase ACSF2, mitochondrial n=1 Tax=Petrolisthes cinctipes TaxID=88211 RepID=A0AAE1FQJ9_PETCI|nr:hypothetical protein Pcinc_016683 [Petrolisthes cinctipes]
MLFSAARSFAKPAVDGLACTRRHTTSVTRALFTLTRRQSSSRSNDEGLQWSYLSNPGSWRLRSETLGQVVARAADLFGDREALVSVYQHIRKTFTQVHQESDRVAAGLLALNLEPGDRIGIWGSNSYEWYLTQMAAAKAGLILVNVNPAYRAHELEYCLNKVSVKAIICDERFKTSDYYQMLCSVAPELPTSTKGDLRSPGLPHLKTVIMKSDNELGGTFRFKDVAEAGDSSHMKCLEQVSSKLRFDDPCSIQFTSGTTGSPKAAVLSHHMIVNNAFGVGHRALYDQKPQRICLSVPLYHCFGCVVGSILGTLFGATCTLPSPGFDPEAILNCIEQEKITSVYGTPTMFVDILTNQRKKKRDLSSLSDGLMAGAPCPQELVNFVMDELHMEKFLVLYGMTETSPTSFQCFPSDPRELRATSVGYPCDHIEVKVMDENGQVVPIGQPGELCTRGYHNFLAYWGDTEKTAEIMGSDRWLKSGDMAVLQPNGYCQIVGRIKDMIIRGGENIYPAELENFLMGHPDVTEAQVFSVPDKRMGEEVAAWIRKEQGSQLDVDSLRNWCKGKVAHYKIPRYMLFKDEFPATVTGKIQKFKMREITIKELDL